MKISTSNKMAGYSSNPFYEEEEDSNKQSKSSNQYGYVEDRRRQLFEEIDNSENRQLESTRNAISSIYDSERMGIATAEELLRQGEQLDNIERKTEEIDKNMTTAQKHLNSIKSVFGGIKTWWTSKKPEEPSAPQQDRPSQLKDTLDKQEHTGGQHPALRVKSDNYQGFYADDEDDLDSRFMAGSRTKSQSSSTQKQQMFQPVTRSKKEEELDDNLVLMSDGMSRLKNLALGLGDEIEKQNDQIDRIAPGVDRVNLRIENQNKQMHGILRK